jgi:beta-lysine 5,6-aminomutase beta subunit
MSSDTDSGGTRFLRAYGDTTDDGMVQLSFTLPVAAGPRAEGAAQLFAARLGLAPALVVHTKGMGPGHTFFIVYGKADVVVDLDDVHVRPPGWEPLTGKEVDARIRTSLRRKLVVLGACIGTDAHTVGIDAILNVKGFAGDKGLEHHREMRVVNLGSQVAIDELVRRARDEAADAVLVSQVVTQRDAHLANVRALSAAFDEAYADGTRPLLVVGGPRFDPGMREGLGVDQVFGKASTPADVASYLVHALCPVQAGA